MVDIEEFIKSENLVRKYIKETVRKHSKENNDDCMIENQDLELRIELSDEGDEKDNLDMPIEEVNDNEDILITKELGELFQNSSDEDIL